MIKHLPKQVIWSSPQSAYVQPQPTVIDMRRYASIDQGVAYAQRIHIPNSGHLVALGMLLSTNQPKTTIRLALYSDDGGYPGQPVFTSGPHFIEAPDRGCNGGSGRQDIQIPKEPDIQAGTYWIAVVSDENAVVFQASGELIETAQAAVHVNGTPWPNPFPRDSEPPRTIRDNAVIVYVVSDINRAA